LPVHQLPGIDNQIRVDMKIKQEAKYIDQEWELMSTRLKAFLATGDQEELHKFRVQTKKLRAMLMLFESTSKEHGLLKQFKPVRKIFKHAGNIRNAHVNLELSEKYQLKNERFEIGQQQIIENETALFRNKSAEYLKEMNAANKRLKKLLQKVADDQIAAYYQTQVEHIAANLTTASFDEEMHTVRKLIKILVYNQKIAAETLKGSLQFNIAYLNKLQDAIGKWHDNMLAEELFSSPEMTDADIVDKIKHINSSVKRKITLLAKDFLIKATTLETSATT
jgi:CHAD domain-containing protein